jgi:signal transduction histidine kinase
MTETVRRTAPSAERPGAGNALSAAERRALLRRDTDRAAAHHAAFLTRSLRVLVGPTAADSRLADLLMLVGGVAGAEWTAYCPPVGDDRVVTSVPAGVASADAENLAAWLAAEQWSSAGAAGASAGTHPPQVVVLAPSAVPRRIPGPLRRMYPVMCALPDGGGVVGFAYRSPAGAAAASRMGPLLARDVAMILASVSRQAADARELADLHHRDEERRRFISTVAHELRTPLASLALYLDLIVESKVYDPAERGEFLDRSHDLVDGMASLVGDLLELSRIDSGQLKLELGPFSGAEIGQAALDELLPLAMVRGIDLGASLGPRLRTVFADRRRVSQILVNLAGNAIKFSPSGSRVELVLRYDGMVALFAVRDQGPGVPTHEREQIFEPFHRGEGVARIVGTGLGLPIARELARLMGGEIGLASVLGHGSSFLVALPGAQGVEPPDIEAALWAAVSAEETLLASRSGAAAS